MQIDSHTKRSYVDTLLPLLSSSLYSLLLSLLLLLLLLLFTVSPFPLFCFSKKNTLLWTCRRSLKVRRREIFHAARRTRASRSTLLSLSLSRFFLSTCIYPRNAIKYLETDFIRWLYALSSWIKFYEKKSLIFQYSPFVFTFPRSMSIDFARGLPWQIVGS